MANFGKEETRRKIVQLARSFVSSAHYLWGTVGNIPDVPNARFRKVCKLLKNNTNSQASAGNDGGCFAIHTAYSNIQTNFSPGHTGFNTCAGGKGTVPAQQVLSAAELAKYLAEVKEVEARLNRQQAAQGICPMPSYAFRYPRRWFFQGVDKGIYLGDLCIGKPHFDCIGLVKYCYTEFYKLYPIFDFDQKQIATDVAGAVPMTSSDPVMDADIIIKPPNDEGQYGHIAMLYLDGARARIVEAADSDQGVLDTGDYPGTKGTWIRMRFPDSALK